MFIFLFGLWGYWHCGHSWPIVPASGDMMMIVEKQMECRMAGETEVFSQKTCPSATFVHHKIPNDQTRVWTPAVAVGSRRLTACAMARPNMYCNLQLTCISNEELQIRIYGFFSWISVTITFISVLFLRLKEAPELNSTNPSVYYKARVSLYSYLLFTYIPPFILFGFITNTISETSFNLKFQIASLITLLFCLILIEYSKLNKRLCEGSQKTTKQECNIQNIITVIPVWKQNDRARVVAAVTF
jgi:hypothetical protein